MVCHSSVVCSLSSVFGYGCSVPQVRDSCPITCGVCSPQLTSSPATESAVEARTLILQLRTIVSNYVPLVLNSVRVLLMNVPILRVRSGLFRAIVAIVCTVGMHACVGLRATVVA